MSTILDVPHFEQSGEGYCLPACARMVLAYLGMERTEAEIADIDAPFVYNGMTYKEPLRGQRSTI